MLRLWFVAAAILIWLWLSGALLDAAGEGPGACPHGWPVVASTVHARARSGRGHGSPACTEAGEQELSAPWWVALRPLHPGHFFLPVKCLPPCLSSLHVPFSCCAPLCLCRLLPPDIPLCFPPAFFLAPSSLLFSPVCVVFLLPAPFLLLFSFLLVFPCFVFVVSIIFLLLLLFFFFISSPVFLLSLPILFLLSLVPFCSALFPFFLSSPCFLFLPLVLLTLLQG